MDNKSYAKCRLCEYKGGCAFNHNGDQELCDLNVTYLDLAEHDKQIRDEFADSLTCQACFTNMQKDAIRIYAEQMKGSRMSWGISPNATEKEKIFADFNDSLNGMNSAGGLSYHHYSQIFDIGRELADKEYQQGRADEQKFVEDRCKKLGIDYTLIYSCNSAC